MTVLWSMLRVLAIIWSLTCLGVVALVAYAILEDWRQQREGRTDDRLASLDHDDEPVAYLPADYRRSDPRSIAEWLIAEACYSLPTVEEQQR